jgi:hypothetical protein
VLGKPLTRPDGSPKTPFAFHDITKEGGFDPEWDQTANGQASHQTPVTGSGAAAWIGLIHPG